MELDPQETTNLITQPEHADITAALDSMLENFFATHSNRNADLWNGGQPIQNSARLEFWSEAWGTEWAPVFSYSNE